LLLMDAPLARRLFAEALGAGTLVAAVVGSGIMATELTDDVALQLLVNAVSTVAALGVLIWALGPISGAHFNPAVTAVAAATRTMRVPEAGGYVVAQIGGAVLGTAVADLMFGLPAWQLSTHQRDGSGVWLGEVVATAGLLFIISAMNRTHHGHLGAVLVPAWIGAAYLFTSSTSFANPAVTIARALTDTFAGIDPSDVPAFVLFQLIGAALGATLALVLYGRDSSPSPSLDLPEPVHEDG
jgi:glycerol uptake facilitator-like aquaporin